jgi:hypothetical protein
LRKFGGKLWEGFRRNEAILTSPWDRCFERVNSAANPPLRLAVSFGKLADREEGLLSHSIHSKQNHLVKCLLEAYRLR